MTEQKQPSKTYQYSISERKRIINQVMRYGGNKNTEWELKIHSRPDIVTLDIFPTNSGYDVTRIMINTIEKLYNCYLRGITIRHIGYSYDKMSIHMTFDRKRNDVDGINATVSKELNIFNKETVQEMK